MAIGAQRNCSGSNKLCLWMLSGASAERGCTLPEHQWDADNNTVSLIVQDPASGLFYWIIVCLEKAKTGSIFSCKVSVSLCWFCVKSACFGSAVAKVEQDAWQGWKAACPGDQSCHSSWNPLGLAVRGWAAPARALLPVCLPQTSHCGFVGSQSGCSSWWETHISFSGQWVNVVACLELSVFFTTWSQSLRKENWDMPARAWRTWWLSKCVINISIYLLVCICQMSNSVITLFKYFLQA